MLASGVGGAGIGLVRLESEIVCLDGMEVERSFVRGGRGSSEGASGVSTSEYRSGPDTLPDELVLVTPGIAPNRQNHQEWWALRVNVGSDIKGLVWERILLG